MPRDESSDDGPRRRTLPHDTPAWVPDDALFFITVCTEPRGRDQLCHPDAARALHESACHRQGLGHWQVPLLLLMPDHVHLLARFAPDPGMTQTVADWKRYTARHAGIAWQRDFFDHRLRSTAAAREKAAYIRANPVRAGLIEKAAAWPYVWHDLTAADAETR
jgi:putative transposase